MRCNRTKNRKTKNIINPFEMDPKEHLGLHCKRAYHLVHMNNSQIGKDTIEVLDLNDIERLKTARLTMVESILERLDSEYEKIMDGEISNRNVNAIDRQLCCIEEYTAYAAVVASSILSSDEYVGIKETLQKNDLWSRRFQMIEEQLKELAFSIAR